MSAGFVPFGQNLQLQSGVPLLKVGTAFFEKLTIVKRMDGGQMGSLMQSVLKDGNLSSVMQNPTAGLTQGIQGQIPGLVAQIQGLPGAGGLAMALSGSGGLSEAMQTLRGAGDNLAGLTNGAAGFFAMLGHNNTHEMAGSAMPAAYGIDVVTAPLTVAPFLQNVTMTLPQVVNQAANSDLTFEEATTWVQNQSATAGNVVTASNTALAWSEANHPLIATVASVAGAVLVPSVIAEDGTFQPGNTTDFQRMLAMLVLPEAAALMAQASAEQLAHTDHAPIDVASMTSLTDSEEQ